MRLVQRMKAHWRDLERGEPGRRFQERYERAHRERSRKGNLVQRVLKIGGGILAIAIGLIEIVFPGPAFLFLMLGGALLATESRVVARTMDWLEVKCRAAWSRVRGWWRRRGPTARGA